MSCNAKNHRTGCNCGFGGRQPTAQFEPDFLDAPLLKRRARARVAKPCKYCGRLVYFIRAGAGGSYLAHDDGNGLATHRCDRMRPIGHPRVIKSDWSRAGWCPMSIETRQITDRGQIINANTMTGPLDVLILNGDRLDQTFPIMFHECVAAPGFVEFGYIDSLSGELRHLSPVGEKLIPSTRD